MGRLASEKYCLPSNCSYTLAVQAGYDYHGNLTGILYPDGRRLTNSYDLSDRQTYAGESSGFSGNSSSTITPFFSRPIPYFSSPVYYPAGELNSAYYGEVVQLASVFNNRQNLTSLSYSKSSQAQWSKAYTWDKNAANLLSVKDNITSDVRTFT
jgi:hypothetical protein